MKGGTKANTNGRILEETIEPVLRNHKFTIFSHAEWLRLAEKGSMIPDRVAVKNVPYKTIYGQSGKTEFVLYVQNGALPTSKFPRAKPGEHFSCRVECKRQEVAGSVDEKFPYLIINAEEAYPEKNVIILVAVEGARPGARDWLKNAIKTRKYRQDRDKEIVEMEISDFLTWVGRAFPN